MPTATLDTPAATPAANPTPSAPPPVQPVAPPPWQEVLSAAKSNNLSLDDQRTALQAWTASTRAFLNSPAASDLKPDQKAQALDYAQKQYDSVTPGPLNVGNLVSGVKQIPGTLIGTVSALSGKNESATTAMVGQGLGDLQEIHSAVASRLPTENNVGRQQLDALFDELQNNAKSGTLVRDGKLNTKYLSTWGDAVKDAAAQYNGEPTKNYFYPQYDANSPENQALITKFYATLDPQALSILRNRMSQSVVSAVGDKATQAAVGQLPAGTPDYVKNNFGSGLDPIQAAMIAIPGFDELELPALADKLGAAGKVAAKAGQLGGVGAAAGAVQTVAKTPNPTASDVGKGAASGAAQFLALGGAHELASAAIGQFPGVKNARINAQLTAMGLTPEQYAKMDANTQAQAQQAAQTALDAADRLRDQGEGAGQPQTPPAQATAILNRRAAIGDVNAQAGATPPDPLAERRQAIQDALDASHAHNSAFTPIFPDEAAQEARMSKAFQAGPEYTPTVEATAKLSDVLPRAERAGIITIADNDDRTPVQMAIDAQHALGTRRAVDAAQALEDQLGPIEQQKQSAAQGAKLKASLAQQAAPKTPIAAPEPQAAPIPAPATPSAAIDAGKAATGGGKGAEASQLPIAAPQLESLPNIVARATQPGIAVADIATQPGMEKIPVAQKADLQVQSALRPEIQPIGVPTPADAEGKAIGAEVALRAVPPPINATEPNAANEAGEPQGQSRTVAPEPTDVPVKDLKLSDDVPNFKAETNEKGVVEPLSGKFDRRGLGPIQVWERLNGDKEVISGRHRLDLAQRNGEKTIPAQVYREADGFDKGAAQALDAELNIRDGNGSVADYSNYFKSKPYSPEQAEGAGLLARAKGKAGFSIARSASEDVFALHQAKRLSDAQAQAIAEAAPGDPGLQAVGTRAALEGKSADYAANLIKAAKSAVDARRAAGQQNDLFGFDDSAMQEMAAQAKRATEIQSGLREQINAVKGAANKPEVAKKLGVNVKNPKAVQAKIASLTDELARWQNWPTQPDLVAETKGDTNSRLKQELATTETPRPTISNNKTGQYSLLGEDQGGFQLTGGKAEDTARAANEELARKIAHAESDAIKHQTTIFEPITGEPNATNPRKIEDENQLQHPRASQGAAIPENGGEVRPGQGEQAGNRGGPVGGAKKPVKGRPFGRPGQITVPDFIVKGTTRIANSIERGDTVDQISANKDAANQLADVEAKRQTNDVRGPLSRAFPDYYTKGKTLAREFLSRKPILPNDALTVLMETAAKDKGEAIAKLNEQEATIRASTKADPEQAKRILAAIDFAKANLDKLAPIAQLADSKYDAQHQIENAKGLASPYRQGYVYHAQDIESPEGFEATASGAGPNARFRMGRTHDTYADSVANGVKFHTLDGPDLLESRIRNGGRIINNTAFVDGLSAIKDPINKAPLTAPITVVKRPNGPDYETVPRGYTKVDLNGRRLGIQDPYVKLVTALTNPSAFEHEQLGRLLREGSQFKKSIQTTLDSFHLGWGAWRYVTAKLGSLDNPTPPFNTLRGRLALDFSPEEARQLAASGKVPQSWLKDIDERNRISGVLVKNGLLPGRGTDALHQELVKSLPILGGSNRYVFDGFIRSAINEIATREFQVQQKMFPKLSEDQLARKVSGEVNNFMGNVGSRGIFKSKTFQDIARIATLAPGLTEGKFRSEVGAPIQAVQAIPQSIRAGRPASGLYARGTAAALVASFAAAQVLNLYFRGYPTWENKEEGHDAKVSGYIPDAIGGGPGLFYDPLEAAAPTLTQLHDIYARTGGDIGKSALQFARDKSGPLVSPLFDLSGTGPTGKPLKSGATSAALAYIPAPIAGQTGFDAAKQVVTGKHAETFPGEFERQALSSLGIRTTGVPASEQRISALAQQYKKANGIPVFTPGGDDDNPYQDLNSALRVSNTADASKAIAALLQKKTPEQVQAYFLAYPNRAFTGSNKNDQKFRATLNPEQQKAFDAAVASRTKLAQNAVNLLASQPNASKETQAVAANFPEMMQVAEVSRQQSLQRDGTKTQAQAAYDALTSAKTPQDQQAAFAAAHASPQVFSEFKSLVAQGNKTKLEGANAGLIKRIGGLGVENGERAQAVGRVLSGISPQGQSLLIQQMISAKVLTPKVMAQINQQKAQQAQALPQAVGQ